MILDLLSDSYSKSKISSGAAWGYQLSGSVPAGRMRIPECPGVAGCSVSALNVVQSPGDLRGGVGLPVCANRRHLAARQRLGDSVRPGVWIRRVHPPATLVVPHRHQAGGEIGIAPAAGGDHFLGNTLGRVGIDDDGSAAGSRTAWSGTCRRRRLGSVPLQLGDRSLQQLARYLSLADQFAIDVNDCVGD